MMEGIENPNLLLYVNTTTLAPQSDNVISLISNWSSNIILQDVTDRNGNFYCPRPFRASRISYTRDFKLKSGRGVSAGWETIALPFNVSTITHEINGILAPFGSSVSGAKPFWLYSLQNGGFNPAMEIVANTPYIICMPNHEDYADDYNQGGNVTFSASNVDIPITTTVVSCQETTNSTISLIPTFCRMNKSENLYAINKETYKEKFAPGSHFIKDLRDVYPFEAYSTVSMKEAGVATPQYIPIMVHSTTGIMDISLTKSSIDLIKIYSLNGQLIKSASREEAHKQLKKGVYIMDGKKVVIK